jgi:tellurite resistance protein TerC
MFYVFGAILLVSALRMMRNGEDLHDVSESFPARMVRRFVPVTPDIDKARFFLRKDGRLVRHAAVRGAGDGRAHRRGVCGRLDPGDSRGHRDPFLVFTSNAFAILGLRSLYFAVAGMMAMFRYLRYSLVLILAFVGMKMLLVSHYHVPNVISLGIILATLGIGVIASVWATRREERAES